VGVKGFIVRLFLVICGSVILNCEPEMWIVKSFKLKKI